MTYEDPTPLVLRRGPRTPGGGNLFAQCRLTVRRASVADLVLASGATGALMVMIAGLLDDVFGWVSLKPTLGVYCLLGGPPLAIVLFSLKTWSDRWRESIAERRSGQADHA